MSQQLIYCWFGGNELPKSAEQYIQTWRNSMPTTPIIAVTEANFEINTSNGYVKAAFKQRKFAFVSDYARLKYLYEHGGIYLDTDVEMCRDLSALISKTDLVISLEYYEWELTGVNTGTIIAPPKHPIIAELLATYENEAFVDCGEATATINQRLTQLLMTKGLVLENRQQQLEQVTVYPYEYFCTNNPQAYTIHHYASSWQGKKSGYRQFRRRLGKLLKRVIGRERFAKIWPK
ncbi:MAG: glycosyltransferase family 32 protein [Culicoidibacterales bacterium]